MVNRRFAAWTLLVLFLAPRFVIPVVFASVKHDESPAGFPVLPSVTANSVDQPFLDALSAEGLRVGIATNDLDAINLAHSICQQLDNGQTAEQQEQSAVNAGLAAPDAREFVVISVEHYCSAQQNKILTPQPTAPQVPS
jgi:hypothetical protein